jgi:uncharacterized protein
VVSWSVLTKPKNLNSESIFYQFIFFMNYFRFLSILTLCVFVVHSAFAQNSNQPLTLTVTIATLEGQVSTTANVGGRVGVTPSSVTSSSVTISPLYSRAEAIAANAAFERIPKEQHIERAQGLFTLLRLTEYESVAKQFDTTILKVSSLNLGQQWKKTADVLGEFQKIIATTSEQFATGEMITIEAGFERVTLDVKFSFTEQHLLNGIAFTPTQPKYRIPNYARLDSTSEDPITVNTGKYILPGLLAMPKYFAPNAKIPVVILLHGAGAEDKDRTSGPLKPSRDLALGLAAQGIASIRYEKRIKLYPLKDNDSEKFTVNDEVIDDAVSALERVRELAAKDYPQLDVSKIVIVAPNLAATLIPRINDRDAAKNPFARRIAGGVLIAANTQKWHETLVARFKRAFMQDGSMNDSERRVMTTLQNEVSLVTSQSLSPKTPINKLPFNLPASFWLDLRSYNHVQAIKNAQFPLLFLHGEQDSYMAFDEFKTWQKELSGKQTVQFRGYPDLVNLLVPKPLENEIKEQPANIPVEVMNDIAQWIKKR